MRIVEIDQKRERIIYYEGNIRNEIGFEDYSGEVTEDNAESVIEELTSGGG